MADPDALTFSELALTYMEIDSVIYARQQRRTLRHLPRRYFFALPVLFLSCGGAARMGLAEPESGAAGPPTKRSGPPITFTEGPPPVCSAHLPWSRVPEGLDGASEPMRCTEWRGHAGLHVTGHMPAVAAMMRERAAKAPETVAASGGPAEAAHDVWRFWGLAWEDGQPAKPVALPWREMSDADLEGAAQPLDADISTEVKP